METKEKNMVKYEIYKTMHDDLTKAMRYGFYYQAIFIEYAIIEDRASSVLQHAKLPVVDKSGQSLKLSKKLNILKSRSPFTELYIRKRITLDLINNIDIWRDQRNKLIHDLANIPYDNEAIKMVAEQGAALCKIFSSKVKSVNTYLNKCFPIME